MEPCPWTPRDRLGEGPGWRGPAPQEEVVMEAPTCCLLRATLSGHHTLGSCAQEVALGSPGRLA